MIVRFRHKGLEGFYMSGSVRGIDARQSAKLKVLLGALAVATAPAQMDIVGTHLHPLKGDLKGFWAVNITGSRRLIFRFEGEHATDVDLVDYH